MRHRALLVGALALALAISGVLWGPGLLFADAQAPGSVAPYVDAARHDLAGNINDHRLLPFHLRFLRAECRADGGAVLLFEERTFPYVEVRYAYVMSAYWPPIGLSGGAELTQPSDPEITSFLGGAGLPCA